MINSFNKCDHIWGPINIGTKTVRVSYGKMIVIQGSNICTKPVGYLSEEVPCKMTKCIKCGEVKYLE